MKFLEPQDEMLSRLRRYVALTLLILFLLVGFTVDIFAADTVVGLFHGGLENMVQDDRHKVPLEAISGLMGGLFGFVMGPWIRGFK